MKFQRSLTSSRRALRCSQKDSSRCRLALIMRGTHRGAGTLSAVGHLHAPLLALNDAPLTVNRIVYPPT
jgi:hypothetical protein